MRSPIMPLGLVLLAAGCAGRAGDAPSLLPRPIESRSEAEPVHPPPAIVPDLALDAKVAELGSALAETETRFTAAADRARRLAEVARESAPGDPAWVDAQMALSELDTLRGGTIGILADLERLAIDRAAKGLPPYPALEAALAEAELRNSTEQALIAAIEARLRAA